MRNNKAESKYGYVMGRWYVWTMEMEKDLREVGRSLRQRLPSGAAHEMGWKADIPALPGLEVMREE